MNDRRDLEPRDLSHARNLPARFYVEGCWQRHDHESLLAPSWQLVGSVGELPAPGSYRVSRHLDRPIVLTRGEDGALRAFSNVCRHRAGPIAAGSGCAEKLVCGYHGWEYGLDGRLLATPGFGEPAAFDRGRIALEPLALLPWRGLLFAHRDGAADRAPAERLLAAIGARIGPEHPLEDYRFDRRVRYPVACNWKLYVDNFLEGYHVPLIHPGLGEQLAMDAYETELGAGYSLQWSPLRQTVTAPGDGPQDARALYFHLFPNTMFNFLPGRLQTNVVRPIGPQACEVIFDYYYADGVAPEEREADQASSDQTQAEDAALCAEVQAQMASGAYVSGRLSPVWEAALWAFQEWVRAGLRSGEGAVVDGR